MRLLAVVSLLLVTMLAMPAQAVMPVAAGVRLRLVDTPILRGEFEQTKTLQGFRKPLLSNGEFLLARDRGVVWTTRHPFPSTIVLTGKQLTVRQGDSDPQALAGQGGGQAIQTANRLLMALLSGRVETLAEQFTVTETLIGKTGWRLLLMPKPGAMQVVFRRMELSGDDHVRTVVLEEASGDRTEIHFSVLRDAPSTLSASEAQLLD